MNRARAQARQTTYQNRIPAERMSTEMMYGMHGIAVAMMVLGTIAALAVITLTVLAAVWLARDTGGSSRSEGQQS